MVQQPFYNLTGSRNFIQNQISFQEMMQQQTPVPSQKQKGFYSQPWQYGNNQYNPPLNQQQSLTRD